MNLDHEPLINKSICHGTVTESEPCGGKDPPQVPVDPLLLLLSVSVEKIFVAEYFMLFSPHCSLCSPTATRLQKQRQEVN